jgi:hypothetical protein
VFAIQQSKAILARSCEASRLFEIALVLVRFDHVACNIVNADHSITGAAEKLCLADRIRLAVPQPTERGSKSKER